MTSLGPVHHIGLVTHDLERLRRFYADTLGFQELGGFPAHGIVFLEAGGFLIELLEENTEAGERRAGWSHLAWSVTDVDRTFAELVGRGAAVSSEPESFPPEAPTYRIAFLRDPDGNLLELLQRLHGPDG